jgi:hypothetical protein
MRFEEVLHRSSLVTILKPYQHEALYLLIGSFCADVRSTRYDHSLGRLTLCTFDDKVRSVRIRQSTWRWVIEYEPITTPQSPVRIPILISILAIKSDHKAITSDLAERRGKLSNQFGYQHATRWYLLQIVRSIPPLAWAAFLRVSRLGEMIEMVRRIGR